MPLPHEMDTVYLVVVQFGGLRPEGRTFESHSSHHVGTIGKSFTRSCLWRLGVLTPTRYPCFGSKHLWVVEEESFV